MEATAAAFIERLEALQSYDELRKIQRYFKSARASTARAIASSACAWAGCSS